LVRNVGILPPFRTHGRVSFRLSIADAVEMFPMTEPASPAPFVERRAARASGEPSARPEGAAGAERRQFSNSYRELSPDARELAQAIDRYKLERRRRIISFEEMLSVLRELGYRKTDDVPAGTPGGD
jgi:hypothetical protein